MAAACTIPLVWLLRRCAGPLDAPPSWAINHPLAEKRLPPCRAALLGSVDQVPALAGKVTSGGRLNVQRALATLLGTQLPPAPPPSCETSWHGGGWVPAAQQRARLMCSVRLAAGTAVCPLPRQLAPPPTPTPLHPAPPQPAARCRRVHNCAKHEVLLQRADLREADNAVHQLCSRLYVQAGVGGPCCACSSASVPGAFCLYSRLKARQSLRHTMWQSACVKPGRKRSVMQGTF